MSFNEEKRNAIKKYMLEKIRKDDENFIRKTADTFAVSETSVRRYLKSCEQERIIRWILQNIAGIFCLQ